MGRKRRDETQGWLPHRVYIHGNNYVYQPKAGGKIKLCTKDSDKLTVLERHKEVVGELQRGVFFEHIINNFYKSDAFIKLAPRTQKDYESYRKTIVTVFGRMRPNAIQPHHVRLFMDKLANARGKGGKPANATANRHKACLQKICSWAYQYGQLKLNPCTGVSKRDEQSRDRYITDQEYQNIYNNAEQACQAAMEIAYLCMARISDVVNIKLNQLLEEGIFIQQAKTKKKQIKAWSDRLLIAVKLARALPCKQGIDTIFLFNKQDGSKYSVRSIQAQFNKAKNAAGITDCTFHDLKAKGVSDFEGTLEEKRESAGHTNIKQTLNYNRKIQIVKPTK